MRDPDETNARGRKVEFLWRLYDKNEHTVVYATLRCSHRTAGVNVLSGGQHPNEFYATLNNEEHEDRGGHSVVGFMLFSGLGVTSKAVGRYSEKGLREFATSALAVLKQHYSESDPQVTRYFPAGPVAAGAI